ncbi:MAG: serine hydrolase [Opitutus sp.]|nr:serine hydrolase [Opitutus sp.]
MLRPRRERGFIRRTRQHSGWGRLSAAGLGLCAPFEPGRLGTAAPTARTPRQAGAERAPRTLALRSPAAQPPGSDCSPPVRVFIFIILAFLLPTLPAAPAAGAGSGEKFRTQLAALVKDSSLAAGVAIKDLVSGEEFLLNADGVFPQGSSIRIHLVTELYRQAAAKVLSVDEIRPLPSTARAGGTGVLRYMSRDSLAMSLRDYAFLMIAVNDHSAANFLTDLVGMDNINASLAAQGTPEIKFRRRVMSRHTAADALENEGTPLAVMRSLALLHAGEVVDRATSDAILEVLSVPEISYFRREVPRDVPFAGRSGSGPTMRCEAGIVRLSDRPFVLCVMVKNLRFDGTRNYSKADTLIGDITRLAMQYFGKPTKRHGSTE